MQGFSSWFVACLLVMSACGGRTAIDLSTIVVSGGASGASFGGASSATGGAQNASGGPSGNPHGGVSGTPEQGGGGAAGSDVPPEHRIATSVSAGTDMSCATERGGAVWCWGANDRGQLGNGTLTASALPVRVSGIDHALTLTSGGTWTQGRQSAGNSAFACAVLGDGTIQCWGGMSWLLDKLPSSYPLAIPGVTEATAVAGGNWHACALTHNGVLCWGDNSAGQLGNGMSATCRGSGCPPGTGSPPSPVHVPGIDDAIAIAGQGSNFSCAVLPDASVRCWGSVTGSIDANAGTPMTVSGVTTTARGIATGFHHACAVSPGGDTVQCWGVNNDGELGDGSTNTSTSTAPVTVRGLAGRAIAVTAGSTHTCALLADGRVQCWGRNAWGQLGNGTRDASLVPVTVSGVSDAVAVSAGYTHTCVLTVNGSIRCWGRGADGQLGNGETTQAVPSPVTVIGF